jgi:prepilin-type N-terminal cleavage/methylation domain-containing protein
MLERKHRFGAGRGGFTLTEILVVIGIIVILAAASVPILGTLTTQTNLAETKALFADALRRARTEAIRRRAVVSVEIVKVAGEGDYEATKLVVVEWTPNEPNRTYDQRALLKPITLPRGVSFSGPAEGWIGVADSEPAGNFWSDGTAEEECGGQVTTRLGDYAIGPEGTLRDPGGDLTVTLTDDNNAALELRFKISRCSAELMDIES